MNKTLLFTSAFLLFFAGSTAISFAETTSGYTQAGFIDRYKTYLHLFDGGAPQSGLSAPTAGPLARDTDTKSIRGLKVDITLKFNTDNPDEISKKWDYVLDDTGFINAINAGSSNDTFLIRVCDKNNPGKCWLNTIPYYRNSAELNYISQKTNAGDWKISNEISNFPILYPASFVAASGMQGTSVGNGVMYKYARDTSGNKNEGTVSSLSGVTLSQPSSVEETLWYCAKNSGSNGQANGETAYSDYKQAGLNDDSVATFGTLCGGRSYFRVGAPLTIDIPATDAAVAAQVNDQKVASSGATTQSNLPECGIGIFASSGTLFGCTADIAYGIYWLTAWVARLFGTLFDFFIGYSLSSASYTYPFVVTGWKLVRDISNIFFIIIMVWTGFSAVFGMSKMSMKSIVPNLIINALLINFSLFATRVVIDLSNITARMFYSEMLVCDQASIRDNGGACTAATAKHTSQGYWPLSEKIVSSFNPQDIFNTSVLQYPNASKSTDVSTVTVQNAGLKAAVTPQDYAIYFGIVSLIAAAIMIAISIMFFKVSFLFLGRVVGLYICMIFSPFAFLSRDMPMFGSAGKLQWSGWGKDLVSYAMLAPIFVFFLYIIYTLLSSDFVQQIGIRATQSSGFFETVISIAIPMLIIFFLLQAAQKAAEDSAGTIGKSIQKYGEQLTGLATGTALGLATGGAGFLGRNLGGRALRSYGNGLTGKKIMVDGKEVDETRAMSLASRAPNSTSARLGNRFLNWGQTSSWNAANAGVKIGKKEYTLGGSLSKGLATYGVKTNDVSGSIPLIGSLVDKDAGKGGILAGDKKRADERAKKRASRIKFDHLSDEQAKIVWEKYKADHIAKAAGNLAEDKWKENEHIDQEASVKPLAESAKHLEDESKSLQTESEKLKADEILLQQKISNASTAGEASRAESDLRENQQKQTETQSKIAVNETAKSTAATELEKARKSTIENLSKGDSYKNSEAFANAKSKSTSEEERRLDKYGKIKNNKQLTNAMQAEYGVDLSNNSFWMKDGKMRVSAATASALGTALTVGLTAVLPGIGTAIGLAVMKNIGEAYGGSVESRANKAMAESFKKNQGKGNKEARMKADLDAINDMLEDAMSSLGARKPSGKISELNDQEIEDGIAAKQYDLEQEIETFRKKRDIAKAANNSAEEREHAISMKKATRLKDKLDKALSDLKRLQNEISKAEEDAKKTEDKKPEEKK